MIEPKETQESVSEVSIDKRFEFFQDYIKTVLNLSAGALVFSITFLHDILGIGSEHGTLKPVQFRGLLGAAWVLFLASVLGSLYYLYFHALSSKDNELWTGHLKWSAIVGLAGLFFGLVSLGVFGWLNI